MMEDEGVVWCEEGHHRLPSDTSHLLSGKQFIHCFQPLSNFSVCVSKGNKSEARSEPPFVHPFRDAKANKLTSFI